MKKHFRWTLFACVFSTVCALNYAQAFPLGDTIEFNGHRYAKIVPSGGATWEQARASAANETVTLPDGTVLKGHLVTITSQSEQDFVSNTFLTANWQHLWLGGFQFFTNNGSANNWAWVTGEEIGNISTDWTYHFLDTGQPGDDPNPYGNEDALRMLINGGTGTPPGTFNDRWNDFSSQDPGPANLLAYVIEFDHLGDNFSSMTTPPTIVSGSHWLSSDTFDSGWEMVSFDDSAWTAARAPYPVPASWPPTRLIPGTNAEYMWHDPTMLSDGTNGPIHAFFRYDFHVNTQPGSRPLIGKAKISVDDDYDLYVNGNLVFENHDGGFAEVVDSVNFSSSLQNGKNVIAIEAVDGGWDNPRDRISERVLLDATVQQQADLLIISGPGMEANQDGDILRFNGRVGDFIDLFAGGGCNPVDLTYGPDGKLYVADTDHPNFSGCDPDNVVGRFNGRTGEFEVFSDPHANYIPYPQGDRFQFGPGGLAFGPDGNLYISDFANDNIHRYQGPFGTNPGVFIDTFVTTGSGGLNEPRQLLFGPDQNLYVVNYHDHSILRYQGPLGTSPGAFIDTYVTSGSGGLTAPYDLIFGHDKRLYIASFGTEQILRFQGPTEDSPGVFIDVFVDLGFGLDGLTFGPDGDLYVSGTVFSPGDYFTGVQRYDGNTGAFKAKFASPVNNPSQLIFSVIPNYVALQGDLNNDGCVDRIDLTEEMLPAIRSGSTDLKFDLNNDGAVNIADARYLVTKFSSSRGAECL